MYIVEVRKAESDTHTRTYLAGGGNPPYTYIYIYITMKFSIFISCETCLKKKISPLSRALFKFFDTKADWRKKYIKCLKMSFLKYPLKYFASPKFSTKISKLLYTTVQVILVTKEYVLVHIVNGTENQEYCSFG